MRMIIGIGSALALIAALFFLSGNETNTESVGEMDMTTLGTIQSITMTSESGPAYGADLPKHRVSLTIDCELGAIIWEKLRSPSDGPDEPIGLFRSQLSADQCAQLDSLLKQVDFTGMRGLQGVTPGHAVISVTVAGENDSLTRQFSPIDGELMAQGMPLVDRLFALGYATEEAPVAALAVSLIDQGEGAPQRMSIMLKNIGMEKLVLTDPRHLPQSDTRQAGLRIAIVPPEEPGTTSLPPEWEFVPIAIPASVETLPVDMKLAPQEGKVFPVELPADLQKSSTYLVQAMYIDYEPAQMQDEAYRIRGAALSDILELTL